MTACRACGSKDFSEVFKFDRPMALANDFVKPGCEHQGMVPVRILFCRNCSLAQLGETVDPPILYKNYAYITSRSQTMNRHFDRLCKDIASENGKQSLVEIGSNDGRFLDFSVACGFSPALGIDPAENLAGGVTASHQLVRFFDVHSAFEAKTIIAEPNHILARHCFCHQEWKPFMEAVSVLAGKNTLVSIEVPYAPDLLRRIEFDSIYSEHTSYLTLKAVAALLKGYPFHVHGVLKYGVHGGAVLVMLRHNDSGIQPHLSADEMLAQEHVTEDSWRNFADRAKEKIEALKLLIADLRSQGKIVSAFGASAKASVLINACGFTAKDIAFVTDNTPHKPGRLVPGTDIPVIEEGEMLSMHPDYAIMTCWNFEIEVLAKMSKWRERGGKFIVPDSQLRIV